MLWKETQDAWLLATEAEGRSEPTISGYKGHLVKFNRFLEAESITEVESITPFHLRRFLVEYAKDHAPHTTKGVYGNIRTWLRWCVSEGVLKSSPTDKVKPPTAPQKTKQVYSTGELKAIRKYIEKSKSPLALRDSAIVSLLMDTGSRATELLSVTLDDIQDNCLLLRQTKGRRPRMVPFGKQAEKALWMYIQRGRPRLKPKDKLVFVTYDGKRVSRDALHSILNRIGKALGFKISAHRFRHTWATMMLRKGVDLEMLRSIGGWSDYKMLQNYTHLVTDDLKRVQERNSLLDSL